MKKRIAALLLAVCLMIPMAAFSAQAADATDVIDGYLLNYTMQYGETVSGICAKYGVDFFANGTADYFAKINKITNYANLMPGKVLWIPVKTVPAGAAYYTLIKHTLKFGETMYGLCLAYGIDYTATYDLLAALNNSLHYIIAGQTVILPVYSAGATVTGGNAAAPQVQPQAPAQNTGATVTPDSAGTPNGGTVTLPTTTVPVSTIPLLAGDTVSSYIGVHTFAAGETMSGVCANYGVDFYSNYTSISALNNIASYANIMPGKTILVPTSACPRGSYYMVVAHKITYGDTVYALCNSYGIDFANNTALIQRLNNRSSLTSFDIGQTLYLPVYVAG